MRVAAAALAPLSVAAATPFKPPARITSVEARLFDPVRGDFTGDILKDDLYAGWNTFMMEGNAGYGRGDALIVVKVAATEPDGGYAIIPSPLIITARVKGKVLTQRRFKDIQTNSREVARVVFLPNVGCVGDIDVTAELEGQTKSVRLAMECGE